MHLTLATKGWQRVLMFRICSSHSVELLLGARRGLVRVITAKPPHEAATKVKPLTGNCPWDLLFFKAPASQSCLLVQSLIAHLHALNPCTAGKAKHCPDCTEISRTTGEPKAQPSSRCLRQGRPTFLSYSADTHGLLQPRHQAPYLKSVSFPLKLKCQMIS